ASLQASTKSCILDCEVLALGPDDDRPVLSPSVFSSRPATPDGWTPDSIHVSGISKRSTVLCVTKGCRSLTQDWLHSTCNTSMVNLLCTSHCDTDGGDWKSLFM